MIKSPIIWGFTNWLIPSLTLLLWYILAQPNPFYTFGVNDLAIFGTGVYAYYVLCLHKNDAALMTRRLVTHNVTTNALLFLSTLSIILAGFEGYARSKVVISDSFSGSAIQSTWYQGYWTPINSLDMRDVEPNDSRLTNVLIVGDSFVSCYGIEQHSDTIGRQLQQRLGDQYGVNIAAYPGWDTVTEMEALGTYPVRPDIVVWSHLPNDIAWQWDRSQQQVDWLRWLLGRTYLTEFALHRFGLLSQPPERAVQQNDSAIANHFALLDGVIAWCESNDVQLIFVVWSEAGVEAFTDQSYDYFVATGHWVVDARDLIGVEYWASPLDAHPNERAIEVLSYRIEEVIE